MTSTAEIRNRIMEQLLSINDKEYLLALSIMIDGLMFRGRSNPHGGAKKLMLG